MKSNQLDKRDIFRKNSLTMWYQNVQDIPCLTCSWCTQHWRQNINMHNFSGGSLAGKGKNARVSSNRWYLHACNSLRLRFLLQQHLSFPAFTSAMIAEQLHWKVNSEKLYIIWTTNLILQPATFLNVISNFIIIGQLNEGWNYQKLPKTMMFSKSPRNAAVESTGW